MTGKHGGYREKGVGDRAGEKQKLLADQVERARLIKKIAVEKGFKNIPELCNILHNDYGISVSHDCLDTDLKRIELFKNEDLQAFKNKVMSTCQAHLDNLNSMSVNAKYETYRIKAIDSYFKNIPKMLEMLEATKKPEVKKDDAVEEVEEDDEQVDVKFGN